MDGLDSRICTKLQKISQIVEDCKKCKNFTVLLETRALLFLQ